MMQYHNVFKNLVIKTHFFPKKLSLSEHKEYVLKLMKRWCSESKENLNLDNFNLEENVDFTLNIDLDKNYDVTASIKCQCGKLISLAKNDSKIQISNYYRHLQSKGCDHMRDIDLRAVYSNNNQYLLHQHLFHQGLLHQFLHLKHMRHQYKPLLSRHLLHKLHLIVILRYYQIKLHKMVNIV
jgi:hypothetical protein